MYSLQPCFILFWLLSEFFPYLRVTRHLKVLAELRSSIPGFPPELKRGVIITDVSPSSPASKAGLQGGDIIQEVDGSPIVEAGQIYNMLGDEVGRRISMKVVRAGQRRTQVLNVTVKTEAIQ
mmetsp:Transcript_9828/g.32887  ORF Transcript_9828/g.32887 Transcript_9828/m.32887 type:complete len:122 (+) Transcript_9828:1047-1412(+)